MNKKLQDGERPWVSQLFARLFSCPELHIPSSHTHYRNKITYNLPFDTKRNNEHYGLSVSLSPFAEKHLNDVCQAIHDWACKKDVSHMFREVMAKTSRDGTMLFRVTVLRRHNNNNDHHSPNNNLGGKKKNDDDNYNGTKKNDDDDDDKKNKNLSTSSKKRIKKNNTMTTMEEDAEYEDRWEEMKQLFVTHMTNLFPAIACICYNETTNRSRPTKDVPLYLLYGPALHTTEITHTGNLPYITGADTFCEVNHEVEDLQNVQKKEWIRMYQGAILLCSGRDMTSWALGFGSMLNSHGEKVFAEVVVVSHCPLVIRDTLVNCARHADKVKCTVLHLLKNDNMAAGIANKLEAAIVRQQQNLGKHDVPVVVISSGGRKGLNPTYIKLLKEMPAIECIIYNSCSTKSLEKDMTDFMDGPNGYTVDAFRSYDFFGGTQYTASIMKMIRRPKTLVLPVGPAGVGKSVLAQTLCEVNPNKYVKWHRDEAYASLKNGGMSMNRSKRVCHEQLLEFLRGNSENSDRDGLVRIVDSTNGNRGGRQLYIHENQPQLVILVELRVESEDKEVILNALLERTQNRLEGGNACHPSFPGTVERQKEKHENILKGIEYPTRDEITEIGQDASASGTSNSESRRTVYIKCDPRDARQLSSLPFEIFLECSTNIRLKEVPGCKKDKPTFCAVFLEPKKH